MADDSDQVECMHVGPWMSIYRPFLVVQGPQKGEICTVVETYTKHYPGFGDISFHILLGYGSGGWDAAYFRPIRKTSIKVFTDMLIPIKTSEEV